LALWRGDAGGVGLQLVLGLSLGLRFGLGFGLGFGLRFGSGSRHLPCWLHLRYSVAFIGAPFCRATFTGEPHA